MGSDQPTGHLVEHHHTCHQLESRCDSIKNTIRTAYHISIQNFVTKTSGVPYPVPFITIVRDGSNFPGEKNVGSASLHSTVGQFLVESHYLNFT